MKAFVRFVAVAVAVVAMTLTTTPLIVLAAHTTSLDVNKPRPICGTTSPLIATTQMAWVGSQSGAVRRACGLGGFGLDFPSTG